MGLRPLAGVCFLFFLQISVSLSLPQSILQYLPKTYGSLSADDFSVHRKTIRDEDYQYCDSYWRYSVEVNNVGNWTEILPRCLEFVKEYMRSPRYSSDCEAVNYYSLAFAKTVDVSNDGKDAWIFDVDETLISNIDYYLGPGTKPDGKQQQEWWSPPIPSSLKFYYELKNRMFKIFLLTGRDEPIRLITVLYLRLAGYRDWDRLIMRGPEDNGTLAQVYKSKKRKELEDEGYRLWGNSGDQWSDLIGYSVAKRSFKLPNPMYYAA